MSARISPLLSFVAISQTNRAEETLQQLLLQTVAFLPLAQPTGANGLGKALNGLFGLEIPAGRLETATQQLIHSGDLNISDAGDYVVAERVRSQIEARVEKARDLEQRVKLRWSEMCSRDYPELTAEESWGCFQEYLFRLFRRHGMQTVALLDSSVAKPEAYQGLLSANLSEVLKEKCPSGNRAPTEKAINDFLAAVGTDQDRTAYLVQLADGAFNYYALSAPPEIAAHLKAKLQELVLFLDTNFLFGVFGLDTNPLVAVSQELLRIVGEHKLPFKLRYHEATDTEMRRTLNAIIANVKGRHWSAELSRAAARSPYVSGIERHFHEANAKNSIDPEVFFKPYEHVDILLKERGVLIYRQAASRMQERAELCAQYQEYLKQRNREKPYEAIDHDMTLLDCVRQLRSNSKSSLEARALIITCDSMLNRFEWREIRANSGLACSILPSHFMQLLRPYIPADPDFDKSFAATFVLPEFGAISGGYHVAARRLLSLLASFNDVKEETASVMLANTLLLDNLKYSKTVEKQQQIVESAIMATNAQLLEEQIALRREVTEARTAKQRYELDLSMISNERDELGNKQAQATQEAEKEKGRSAELESRLAESEATRTSEQEMATSRFTNLEERLAAVESQAAASERRLESSRTGWAVVIALFAIATWEWTLHHVGIGQIVLRHPNAYSIRALVPIALVLLALGLARPKLRVLLWVTIGVGVIISLLSLLGGPHT